MLMRCIKSSLKLRCAMFSKKSRFIEGKCPKDDCDCSSDECRILKRASAAASD